MNKLIVEGGFERRILVLLDGKDWTIDLDTEPDTSGCDYLYIAVSDGTILKLNYEWETKDCEDCEEDVEHDECDDEEYSHWRISRDCLGTAICTITEEDVVENRVMSDKAILEGPIEWAYLIEKE